MRIRTNVRQRHVICATSLALVGGAACAQSSVTLYGELDAGLAYLNNVGDHALYKLTSGVIDGSYWGLQGTEDLGGGAKAIFRLERGYSVATGEGFNDHPFYVGLGTETLGTLTLGHQYDSIHDYFAPFTLTGGTGGTAFAHPFDNDNANNSFLAANSVKYTSANYGWLQLRRPVRVLECGGAVREQPRVQRRRELFEWSVQRGRGVSAQQRPRQHERRRVRTDEPARRRQHRLPRNRSTPEYVRRRHELRHRRVHAGRRLLALDQLRRDQRRHRRRRDSIALNNYEINGIYQLTPALCARRHVRVHERRRRALDQGALQADYLLSKRTDVYLESIYQRASSGAPAVINTNDPASGRNQLMIATGIRHRF